ncbi:MAG: efflux RND transporter periplasmic adaptor subunit [Flavobacteriaceae bacterium]|nr:efflux RND transporter periplasmic adaptor subunit [Flavobacteriaceae bacterium]
MNTLIKYIIPILLLVISCGKSDNQTEKLKTSVNSDGNIVSNEIIVSKTQFESENMKLVNLQEVSFPTYIKTTGTIDVPPNSRAVISAQIGGYIKNSPLLIGDKVKKGQALVTIENIDFIQMQQEYLETSEQLTYLKSEYERQKELFAEKISSKKSFLKAESDYKKTKAVYNGLRKKLLMLNINPISVENGDLTSVSIIYAPISGSITAVNISTGAHVSPADKIMEIVNTEHIHLELKVFEKDVLKLKKGQKVIFRIPESTNESFEGDIHLIGKLIDENRTVQVHAHIDHKVKHNFMVGMFVETDIVIEENNAKALPENAVITVDDKSYVLILKSTDNENYTFIKKKITTGLSYNNFTEIKSNNEFKKIDQFLFGAYNLISEDE